jgi:hypothetical protein
MWVADESSRANGCGVTSAVPKRIAEMLNPLRQRAKLPVFTLLRGPSVAIAGLGQREKKKGRGNLSRFR